MPRQSKRDVCEGAAMWLMRQLTARSDLQNCSFEIVIKQLRAIKKQRLASESQKTIWGTDREGQKGGAVQIKPLRERNSRELSTRNELADSLL